MKNGSWKLQSFELVATVIAILVVLLFLVTPVSASTCHPGFVVVSPSSNSFQFNQPSFSSIIITSPTLNQASVSQFTRPTFSSTIPNFIINGKTYSPLNAFGW